MWVRPAYKELKQIMAELEYDDICAFENFLRLKSFQIQDLLAKLDHRRT